MEREHIPHAVPVSMPVSAGTGPVLGRCRQHRSSAGPVLARGGMFTGIEALEIFHAEVLTLLKYSMQISCLSMQPADLLVLYLIG